MRTRKDRQEIKAIARERFREQRGTAILLLFVYLLMIFVSSFIDALTQELVGDWAYHLVALIGALLLYVLFINMYGQYVLIYQGAEGRAGALFSGFSVNFWRKLGGYLWMLLLLFLWALPGLLVIIIGFEMLMLSTYPADSELFLFAMFFLLGGIVLLIALAGLKLFAYLFTPYILALYPNVKATDAVRLSIRMTMGYRGDLLTMELSFLAWISLVIAPLILLGMGLALLEFALGLGVFFIISGALGAFFIYFIFVGPYMALANAGNFVELRDRAILAGEILLEELGLHPVERQEVTDTVVLKELTQEVPTPIIAAVPQVEQDIEIEEDNGTDDIVYDDDIDAMIDEEENE